MKHRDRDAITYALDEMDLERREQEADWAAMNAADSEWRATEYRKLRGLPDGADVPDYVREYDDWEAWQEHADAIDCHILDLEAQDERDGADGWDYFLEMREDRLALGLDCERGETWADRFVDSLKNPLTADDAEGTVNL